MKMNRWKPEIGETYFSPCVMFCEADYDSYEWAGEPVEENWYKSGFVYRTMKEALDVAEKMLAVAKEHEQND